MGIRIGTPKLRELTDEDRYIASQKLEYAITFDKYSQVKEAIKEGAEVNSIFNFGYTVQAQAKLRDFIWKVDYRMLALLIKNGFKITEKMPALAGDGPEGERILARFQGRIQDAQILVAESSRWSSEQLITETLTMLPTVLVRMIRDYILSYLDEISDPEYVIEEGQRRVKESMRYKVNVDKYCSEITSVLCQAVFNNVKSNLFDNNKRQADIRFVMKVEEMYRWPDMDRRHEMGGLFRGSSGTKYDNRILFTILDYVRD